MTDGLSSSAPSTVLPLQPGIPGGAGRREVAVEAAVEVRFGGVPFAVMMLTPGDLEDFAFGFSLTEGIVARAAEIRGVEVSREAAGWSLAIEVAPDRMHALLARRRSMAGRTSCGVCGIEDINALERAGPGAVAATGAAPVPLAAIGRALAALSDHQPLGRATGATHAAALAAADGTLLLVREDVGRHNALDKLVGASLRGGHDPAAGFVLVTSRCSFEMVEKTASLGARLLVAISAPTSLAIERAKALDLGLVAVARRDTVTVFHGGERIAAAAAGMDEPPAGVA